MATKNLTALLSAVEYNDKLDIDSYARFALATGVDYKKSNIVSTLKNEGYTEEEIKRFFEVYNKGL